jgi:hypothetical protein
MKQNVATLMDHHGGAQMANSNIHTKNLMLRCYANMEGDQWQAFCIDLCLASQGDTFPEVKQKLEGMMVEYVYDALAGEDREFAEQLLNRKAPFRQIITYHGIKLLHHFGLLRDGLHKLFKEPMPLIPQRPIHA